ncbi:hypothetical protein [Paenibacillus xylanexedens]|uniref:hypothetical protein n=1 Tax=Paenibacillus xylanexedens TaxID=528191 RepID=UPI001C92D8B6|nr:hypothetical protein [Paenibacillus xylanexedens]
MTVEELISIMGYEEHKDYLLSTMDFIGYRNEHLKNKYNDFRRQFYFIGRHQVGVTLTGEEKVFGDYLLFDTDSHDEAVFVEDFDDLKQLEEAIISGAGYTNPFTGDMVAVIFGGRQPFEVVGINEDDEEEVFDKCKEMPIPSFNERCGHLKVRWKLG